MEFFPMLQCNVDHSCAEHSQLLQTVISYPAEELK